MSRPLLSRCIRLVLPAADRPTPRPSIRPRLERLEDRLTPSLGFAPQVTFAVGTHPNPVATADFNGDNRPDVVTANAGDGTVSVLLNTTPTRGDRARTFAAPVTFAVGTSADALAVGDFNGDGKPDLVVGDGNGVSVLLNTTPAGATTASFAPQQTFSAYSQFSYSPVAVGDFDGDGRPDIVTANYDTASVLLNTTGAGATTASFAAPQAFAAGGGADSVAVDDFNGDGRPDLVVANYSDGTVSVLLNTTPAGSATFPAVVADVPGLGVEEYDRDAGAWVQLNAQNPSDVSLLAADPRGDVFAYYPGYGVYRYSPSTFAWTLVNGHDAVALTVDAQGDAFLSIAGAGVGEFRLNGTAQLLNTSAAALLAADANGNLYRRFHRLRRLPLHGVGRRLDAAQRQRRPRPGHRRDRRRVRFLRRGWRGGVSVRRHGRAGQRGDGDAPGRRPFRSAELTAHAMEGDRERCLAAGRDGYVSRPIRSDPRIRVMAEVVAAGAVFADC